MEFSDVTTPASSEVELPQRSNQQQSSLPIPRSFTIHGRQFLSTRYSGVPQEHDDAVDHTTIRPNHDDTGGSSDRHSDGDDNNISIPEDIFQDEEPDDFKEMEQKRHSLTSSDKGDRRPGKTDHLTPHATTITKDLINITEVIFYPSSLVAATIVKAFFYTNLFLVLGDYVLVMGRSVSAVFADQICLPVAGAIASVLMFGLCQFRTMANLGRSVSLASLLALLIVLLQCLFHHRLGSGATTSSNDGIAMEKEEESIDDGIWGKFSSLAGIGFAVGSQKLFLNIRYELRHREQASKVLAGSLTVYGLAYVTVILLAGPGTIC